MACQLVTILAALALTARIQLVLADAEASNFTAATELVQEASAGGCSVESLCRDCTGISGCASCRRQAAVGCCVQNKCASAPAADYYSCRNTAQAACSADEMLQASKLTAPTELVQEASAGGCSVESLCRDCKGVSGCATCRRQAAVGCCVENKCAAAPAAEYYSCRNTAQAACSVDIVFQAENLTVPTQLVQEAFAGGCSVESLCRDCTGVSGCASCRRQAAVGCCVQNKCASAPAAEYYSCRNTAQAACSADEALQASKLTAPTELVQEASAGGCSVESLCRDCKGVSGCATCRRQAAVGCCVENKCAAAPAAEYYSCRNTAQAACSVDIVFQADNVTVPTELVQEASAGGCSVESLCRDCTGVGGCASCRRQAAVGCCVENKCASAPAAEYYSCRNTAQAACSDDVAFQASNLTALVQEASAGGCSVESLCRDCTGVSGCASCKRQAAVGCCVQNKCASAPAAEYYSCRNTAQAACSADVALEADTSGVATPGHRRMLRGSA